jgi:tetratricopeptide (TPR) repeat protein
MRLSLLLAVSALAAVQLGAQGTPPKNPGGTTGSTTGSGTPGSTIPSGNIPSNRTNLPPTSTTDPGASSRGAYYYGKVVMPDGTAPPSQVVIERICGSGQARPQAYADSKGNFSFQVGQTQEMIMDATVSRPSSGMGTPTGNTQNNQLNSFACDLRASLPGYRSDVITLAGRRNMDDPDVGTIFLHRLSNVEGLTTSATSALAPKDAHKAYEKGMDAVKKSKVDEAQADFIKATDIYPRYASAWYELGRVYEQREHIPEAREAFGKSIAADSKFVNPYEHLYILSLKEQKWDDVATTTDRIMRLNPYDFPAAVYYNAVANLQLNKLDVAEKSIREAASMDSAYKNPKINYVLGAILARKGDFKDAAESLRTYLKSDAITDRDHVKKLLTEVEKQIEAKTDAKQ